MVIPFVGMEFFLKEVVLFLTRRAPRFRTLVYICSLIMTLLLFSVGVGGLQVGVED